MVSHRRWILLVVASSVVACSSGKPSQPDAAVAQPATPAPNVFDPLTQQLDRAREVQGTVDRQADASRQALEAAERGDAAQ
jgi:hypothetical protein